MEQQDIQIKIHRSRFRDFVVTIDQSRKGRPLGPLTFIKCYGEDVTCEQIECRAVRAPTVLKRINHFGGPTREVFDRGRWCFGHAEGL